MQFFAHTQTPVVSAANTSNVDEQLANFFSPNTLDTSSEHSPHMANSRRESFATGPPLFSPKTEDWQSVDMQSIPSNNPFVEQQEASNYLRMDQHSSHAFSAPSTSSWGMAAQTPLPQFDPAVAAGFEVPTSVYQNAAHAPMPFPSMFGTITSEQKHEQASPKNEWSATSQSIHQSPTASTATAAAVTDGDQLAQGDLRRDGVRKRNARFEIPPDHNLNNIDQLIAESTNEVEIKELKQQKRLLRNRQAALDSRQRKKQHTERLEDEKKQYTATIGELDVEVNSLRIQLEECRRECQMYMQYCETLTFQREEMIRSHTVESRELRKKVSVLTENIAALENNSVPTPGPTGTTINGPFGEVDSMCMPGGWDNANFLHQYGMIPEAPKQTVPPSTSIAKKAHAGPSTEGEKAATQGGLLFMLFLVGAFVMSSPSPPAIPRVSEDVRSASAALLDNVLKEAAVPSSAAVQPLPSQGAAINWAGMSSSGPMTGVMADSVPAPMLGELNDFIQPSRAQTNEQAFSMSAAQYNGVSDQTFLQNGHPERLSEPSQGRKNLAAALAEIRETNKQSGSADVYTRTLLWDQIPRDIVRDFIKMFAENNSAQIDPQQCNEIMS
ncbi:Basic-leucine zipper (bZIP) transcription factor [Cordyceps fumosorosea ARSEF 2679]|uniref:Basic-leucine zipper (BZIP) transcription factor n=1 Tax=Cordyceps fumosorosea (strain ARSEF 2679) TaxID=1081104 RepID=A0A168E0D5_CORFA|nr:Basic-leucine zipper (bZIP) transcription factor [Cordyceps fumosorosea ARSEF 2679]OAA73226.1 Basic-leucine zipper (bZIP) transcription factor [Cordyceps fumosorosea ARSEF 2679]